MELLFIRGRQHCHSPGPRTFRQCRYVITTTAAARERRHESGRARMTEWATGASDRRRRATRPPQFTEQRWTLRNIASLPTYITATRAEEASEPPSGHIQKPHTGPKNMSSRTPRDTTQAVQTGLRTYIFCSSRFKIKSIK